MGNYVKSGKYCCCSSCLELWSVPACSRAQIIDKVDWECHRKESAESMACRKAAHREVILEKRGGCCRDKHLLFSTMSDLSHG